MPKEADGNANEAMLISLSCLDTLAVLIPAKHSDNTIGPLVVTRCRCTPTLEH